MMAGGRPDRIDPGFWDEPPAPAPAEALVVDVAGFEGPLDLLLDMARSQKVDLARISILALAEQYLAFIDGARRLRLELAADYLVMAAWLAYLKSRLLLPEPMPDDEPSGEELAAALALRLRRLEAMRQAARRLADRNRLGRDVFARGAPEMSVERRSAYAASLYDLLSAYAAHRRRAATSVVHMRKRAVWSLLEAREILVRLIGEVAGWTPLSAFLSPYLADEDQRRTATASSFAAGLELAREGRLELRQAAPFGPLLMRAGAATGPVAGAAEGDRDA